MIHILQSLAQVYQESASGRKGAVKDFTIGYEKFLRLADAADGDEREIAELELRRAEAESHGLFCIDRQRRSHLPERLRLSADGGESWLFSQIGGTTPEAKRLDLSNWFEQAASREVPSQWQPAWAEYFTALALSARDGGGIQPFRREDSVANQNLLAALAGVIGWQGPSLIRYASSAICNDSKLLQALEPRLRVALGAVTGMSSLEDFGILRKPRPVTFHGPLVLHIGTHAMDFTPLPAPVTLSETNFIPGARIATEASMCLTVENEDTFHELAATNPGVLLILTSYAGSGVRHLIRQLPENLEFYHFGDSDPAGFDILRDLRERTGRNIQALIVPGTHQENHRTRPLSETETRILRKLLDITMPDDLRPHLRNLLDAGTLGSFEQESIPVNKVWQALL